MHEMQRARKPARGAPRRTLRPGVRLPAGGAVWSCALIGCTALLASALHAGTGTAAFAPPGSPVAAVSRPTDLRDVNAWVAWKNATQIDALPAEARLFFRRGLIARQSGQDQEAIQDLRGAIELD